jgi:hypothetical protein
MAAQSGGPRRVLTEIVNGEAVPRDNRVVCRWRCARAQDGSDARARRAPVARRRPPRVTALLALDDVPGREPPDAAREAPVATRARELVAVAPGGAGEGGAARGARAATRRRRAGAGARTASSAAGRCAAQARSMIVYRSIGRLRYVQISCTQGTSAILTEVYGGSGARRVLVRCHAGWLLGRASDRLCTGLSLWAALKYDHQWKVLHILCDRDAKGQVALLAAQTS